MIIKAPNQQCLPHIVNAVREQLENATGFLAIKIVLNAKNTRLLIKINLSVSCVNNTSNANALLQMRQNQEFESC
jgi:hypothetical protein